MYFIIIYIYGSKILNIMVIITQIVNNAHLEDNLSDLRKKLKIFKLENIN